MADMAVTVRQVAVRFPPAEDRPADRRRRGVVAAIGRFIRASIMGSCELQVGAMKQAPTSNSTVGAVASMASFSMGGPRLAG